MEKTILKPYTKKETETIYDLWYTSKASMKERTIYAESIGRTFTQCASKASYEKGIREGTTERRPYNKSLERHVAGIQTTHMIKAPIRNAIINIGNIMIEIPSKTFHVNGIKIDW